MNTQSKTAQISAKIILVLGIIIAIILMNRSCSQDLEQSMQKNAKLSNEIAALKQNQKQQTLLIQDMENENDSITLNYIRTIDSLIRCAVNCPKNNAVQKTAIKQKRKLSRATTANCRRAEPKVSIIENTKEMSGDCEMRYMPKTLLVAVTRNVFNKKGTNLKETQLLGTYYRNEYWVENQGFLKDEFKIKYEYTDKNSKKQTMVFHYALDQDAGIVKLTENSDYLYYNMPHYEMENDYINSTSYTEPYANVCHLEKFIDEQQKTNGTWEIIGGILASGIGGYGLYYFNNHPVAIINLHSSNEQLFYKEIHNDFGKGVSTALLLGGLTLTTKGIIDKCLAVQVSATEVKFTYTIK